MASKEKGFFFHQTQIHHTPVGIAIRRFTQRLQSDRTLLEKLSLVLKEQSLANNRSLLYREPSSSLTIPPMRNSALIVPNASIV
jgi:hypothetical protein